MFALYALHVGGGGHLRVSENFSMESDSIVLYYPVVNVLPKGPRHTNNTRSELTICSGFTTCSDSQ